MGGEAKPAIIPLDTTKGHRSDRRKKRNNPATNRRRAPQCGHSSSHMQDHSSVHPPASVAFVEIEKPCHGKLLGSQAIISARDEFDKSAVPQVLQLLAYLRFDVLVAGIEIAEMPVESVDLSRVNSRLPSDSTHFITSSSQPRVSGDSFLRNSVFCHSSRTASFGRTTPSLHDVNLARLRDAADRMMDPIQPARRAVAASGLALFDDVAHEEMFWNDEEIDDRGDLTS